MGSERGLKRGCRMGLGLVRAGMGSFTMYLTSTGGFRVGLGWI